MRRVTVVLYRPSLDVAQRRRSACSMQWRALRAAGVPAVIALRARCAEVLAAHRRARARRSVARLERLQRAGRVRRRSRACASRTPSSCSCTTSRPRRACTCRTPTGAAARSVSARSFAALNRRAHRRRELGPREAALCRALRHPAASGSSCSTPGIRSARFSPRAQPSCARRRARALGVEPRPRSSVSSRPAISRSAVSTCFSTAPQRIARGAARCAVSRRRLEASCRSDAARACARAERRRAAIGRRACAPNAGSPRSICFSTPRVSRSSGWWSAEAQAMGVPVLTSRLVGAERVSCRTLTRAGCCERPEPGGARGARAGAARGRGRRATRLAAASGRDRRGVRRALRMREATRRADRSLRTAGSSRR